MSYENYGADEGAVNQDAETPDTAESVQADQAQEPAADDGEVTVAKSGFDKAAEVDDDGE